MKPHNVLSSAMRQKAPERELIALQVAEYLKSNIITQLPAHMSKNRQLIAMRDNELELISFYDLADRWEVSGRLLTQILFRYPLLLYIMRGKQKFFSVCDIERIETIKDYKLCKQTC